MELQSPSRVQYYITHMIHIVICGISLLTTHFSTSDRANMEPNKYTRGKMTKKVVLAKRHR